MSNVDLTVLSIDDLLVRRTLLWTFLGDEHYSQRTIRAYIAEVEAEIAKRKGKPHA